MEEEVPAVLPEVKLEIDIAEEPSQDWTAEEENETQGETLIQWFMNDYVEFVPCL